MSTFMAEELEKLRYQIPYTTRRRKLVLEEISKELDCRNFKSLNEESKEDLEHVIRIVSDMFPESNVRAVKDYAKVSIRLWKMRNSQS